MVPLAKYDTVLIVKSMHKVAKIINDESIETSRTMTKGRMITKHPTAASSELGLTDGPCRDF